MPYLLPLMMLFGFLTIHVRPGDDFAVIMPLVLLVLAVGWLGARTNDETAKEKNSTWIIKVVSVFVSGLVLFWLFGLCNVVTYDALGPQLFGVPLVLVVVWASLVFGVGAVADRLTSTWHARYAAAFAIATAWALVASPAFFHLGVLAYRTTGLYYGVPFAHVAFWSVSTVAGFVVTYVVGKRREATFPLAAIAGPLLLAGYATGVCIAVGAWVPAVLGLVVAQLGFRAMYYL